MVSKEKTKKKEKPYTEVITEQKGKLEEGSLYWDLIDITEYQKPKNRS